MKRMTHGKKRESEVINTSKNQNIIDFSIGAKRYMLDVTEPDIGNKNRLKMKRRQPNSPTSTTLRWIIRTDPLLCPPDAGVQLTLHCQYQYCKMIPLTITSAHFSWEMKRCKRRDEGE